MKVPENVRQAGIALRKKMLEEWRESQLISQQNVSENVQSTGSTEGESVEDIIAREERLKRRKRQPKPAKKMASKAPDPVTVAADPPPEPLVYIAPDPDLHPLSGTWVKPKPFGDTPPRDVPRPALVAFAVDIIRREGPQSTNALLDRAFPGISADDRAALRQRLPKWLMAEYREADPPLTTRRYRSKEGNEQRENLFGFWPEPHHGKSRQAMDVAEVLTAIAELKAELVTLRQVQSELLQRQSLLKEGFAAMLEKLTWNGEL